MSAKMQEAHSSWIAHHGWSKGLMTLITKDGISYVAPITEGNYKNFKAASSPGAYFNTWIKPYAKVTLVDVAEAVALAEAAKAKLATATPSTVAVPTKSRKAPAKSLLPTKPAPKGATDAWIDFRCIADPTTGPGLVKALKRFIELKGKDREDYAHYIPYMGYGAPPGQVKIAALGGWGTGYVDPKYLKAYPEGVTNYKALANAYRAAYRSWTRRNEARAAKVKAASGPVKGAYYAFTGVNPNPGTMPTPKPLVMPSNPVVQVVTVPVGVDQKRVDRALLVLDRLDAGWFGVYTGPSYSQVNVAGYTYSHKTTKV